MTEHLRLCPHCGGNIETELNCSICRVLFGNGKTFRSEDWLRRTPSPATKAMLAWAKTTEESLESHDANHPLVQIFRAFLAEWPNTATPPAPEQPAPSSPWRCSICGQPVQIGDDLRPYHLSGPAVHEAELSDADLKTLADGLRLTD